MSTVTFAVEFDDKGLTKLLSSGRFFTVLNKHLSRQFLGFGTFMKNEIKRELKSGIDGPALGVQKYIKGSDKLLVHTYGFTNAVRFKYTRRQHGLSGVRVGWIESSGSNPKGYPYSNLASIFEFGKSWPPTERERLAVAIQAKEVGAPFASGDRKMIWTIPPRPFLGELMNRPMVMRKFQMVGEEVVRRTLDEVWNR